MSIEYGLRSSNIVIDIHLTECKKILRGYAAHADALPGGRSCGRRLSTESVVVRKNSTTVRQHGPEAVLVVKSVQYGVRHHSTCSVETMPLALELHGEIDGRIGKAGPQRRVRSAAIVMRLAKTAKFFEDALRIRRSSNPGTRAGEVYESAFRRANSPAGCAPVF